MTGQFKYTGYSYRDENKDFEVRRPFGPSVYFGKFDSKEIQFLQKLSHEAKDKSEKPKAQSQKAQKKLVCWPA